MKHKTLVHLHFITSFPVFSKACVEIVKERRDGECAIVLKAMLELGRSQEKTVKTDKSDYKSIISVAQKDEMESVVMKRYGKEAFRMFRYLSQEDRFVETGKIANASLTEKKDTPQILMKMWRDSYLHIFFFAKNKLAVTGVYVPFLVWKVDKLIVWRKMLDEMYHASLNLSLRLTHELDSEREIRLTLKIH
ncbi:hypothetical protein Bca52824_000761 [Brassica carinata]|uniref:DNA-directed RNA polymerase III subunit RPC3 n=1 Tax=Brassica carinata TaxID=52824 RepID=A0A8X7WG70_BRACI|nr:hypothetical protein Bca52824_000761 [Brassica carinata]